MYRILIIDDHALVRDGMRLLLEGLEPLVKVFEAGSCDEALQQLSAIEPLSLILLDLELPGINGLEGIPLLRQQHPATPIIILSASQAPEDALVAWEAGAQGFITKSSSGDVILSAIRLILSGGTYFPPELVLRMKGDNSPPPLQDKPVRLTPRQLDVLKLLVEGKPNKVIGRMLDMAESTVRVHTTAIFKMLDVTNRTEAAYTATRLGLVSKSTDGAAQNTAETSSGSDTL